jgi:hypothetical protein
MAASECLVAKLEEKKSYVPDVGRNITSMFTATHYGLRCVSCTVKYVKVNYCF